jgi:hypothetical protein
MIKQRLHVEQAGDSQVSAHFEIGGDSDLVGIALARRPLEESV